MICLYVIPFIVLKWNALLMFFVRMLLTYLLCDRDGVELCVLYFKAQKVVEESKILNGKFST